MARGNECPQLCHTTRPIPGGEYGFFRLFSHIYPLFVLSLSTYLDPSIYTNKIQTNCFLFTFYLIYPRYLLFILRNFVYRTLCTTSEGLSLLTLHPLCLLVFTVETIAAGCIEGVSSTYQLIRQ